MATETAMANGDGGAIGYSDVDSNGNGYSIGDSNGHHYGNGHDNGNNNKGRVASSCAGNVQCCGRGNTLPPPPWTQRKVHSPVLHHEGDTTMSVCSL
jgi:hypothetical protein